MENKEVIAKIISDNIKAERARKGLTQEKTACLLNVSVRTYQRWEQEPTFDCIVLVYLSSIFGCKIEDFYVGINVTECGTK